MGHLSSLDLVAFMVDAVHFGDHVCVVALGITIDGMTVPLAIEEGSTENATLVTSLIVGLRDAAWHHPAAAGRPGRLHSPAPGRTGRVRPPRDRPLPTPQDPQRAGPAAEEAVVERRIRAAYHADSALAAQADLEAPAAYPDKTHPGAAASLREGGRRATGREGSSSA